MSGRAPLVHVGYPTAGSSWLRRTCFAAASLQFQLAIPRQQVFTDFILPHDFDFNPTDLASRWASFFERIPDSLVPVISHERLVGSAHSGGYDALSLARRIEAAFNSAKILIITRRQQDMIPACYDRYVRHVHGNKSFSRYIRPTRIGRGAVPQFSFSFFQFHRLVAAHATIFGANNVLVLPFEGLVLDPRSYIGEIASFVGISPAATADTIPRFADLTSPFAHVLLQRLANMASARAGQFCGQALRRLKQLQSQGLSMYIKDGWMRQMDSEVWEGFASSNTLLQRFTRTDLAQLGYLLK